MDLPLLLGTVFTDRRGPTSVIGYVVHLSNGLVFALGYYGILRAAGPRCSPRCCVLASERPARSGDERSSAELS